jgi:futalosine hydrolase
MRTLIVTATSMEVVPLVAAFGDVPPRSRKVDSYSYRGREVDVLITGVGMVATAAWTSHVLAQTAYDLALNVGLCGSFDRSLAPGSVVHVVSDRIAELGAEDGDAFLTIEELNLPGDRDVVNSAPPVNAGLAPLPRVDAITVNTVHGNARSIAAVSARFKPHVESMEGAAFMYACLIHEVPFAQVRAVSNIVEQRNRDAWKMADAIGGLGRAALSILDHL